MWLIGIMSKDEIRQLLKEKSENEQKFEKEKDTKHSL